MPRTQRVSDDTESPLRMLVITGPRPPANAAGDRDTFRATDVLENLEPTLALCCNGKDERDAHLSLSTMNRTALGIAPLNEVNTRFRALVHRPNRFNLRVLSQDTEVLAVFAMFAVFAVFDALRTRVVLASVSRLAQPGPFFERHGQGVVPGPRFDPGLNREREYGSRINATTRTALTQARPTAWTADEDNDQVTARLQRLGVRREPLVPVSRRSPAKAWTTPPASPLPHISASASMPPAFAPTPAKETR